MSQEITILPVFISSTWLDLRPEHDAAERAINSMRETKYIGMKYFGSRDETTRQASLDEVDRSRVYVGIIAGRYGSGITEAEYDRAGARGLPRFIYFKDPATIDAEWRETEPEQLARLDAFKQKLRANHLNAFDFKSPDDLAALVTADLHRWLFDKYLTPKLQGALDGTVSREEAQELLGAVKDLRSLRQDLLDSLRGAGLTVIPTLHQLRAPVGDFVGREKEIQELLATLSRGSSAAITGISGMGGIGKTELSLYVASKLRDAYPDAQLILDMRGTDERPRSAGDALAACIRAFLGLEQHLPDDTAALTRLYLSVLEGKRALILLDNALDSAQVRPLMPPIGSALLITSRNVITLPHMKRITLDQLSAVEARQLLTSIASRVPDEMADRICYLCGYLPLAIRAAGSLLDVTADLAPETYVEQLQDERGRLELIGVEGVDLGVEASFGLSYARLTRDAARIFCQLAVFPATFDARAEETVCEDTGHKHLSELLRRNLVRYNGETQRYSLHDLARLFADSRMRDDERYATRIRHAAHYLTVLNECDDFYIEGGNTIKSGLALFDLERRNIEAGQEWACGHSSSDEAAAQLCNEYPTAGVYVLNLLQHPREFISWLEAALAAAHQLKDRYSEGRHLGHLGVAYKDLGEIRRAVEFHGQALVILREIGNRSGEAATLGNLGVAYGMLGETQRAVEFLEQHLTIARENGDRLSEGNALGNLGLAYDNLGEPQRAIEFHEQRLAIVREIGDRRGEGIALGNLGRAYAVLGELRRALDFYEQRLAIAREMGDRRGESIALFGIGLALDELGDRARAIAHVEAAREICEQIESPYAEWARAKLAEWRGEA